MKPTLLILAAGMGSRYGGLKQVDALGPKGEALIEYSIFDAIRAGFGKVVFVIRENIEDIFKEKISGKFSDRVEVSYAFQEIDTPIPGLDEIPTREKPWGTAHAVLVARDVIQEPFAVINADDYYGISALQSISRFLREECAPDHYAMVGYWLRNTLSDHGSVSRGICEMDERRYLTSVVERHKVQRLNGVIYHHTSDGEAHALGEDTLVSMNFWGFHPNIFEEIRLQFVEFARENRDNPKAEFYIPLVANHLIKEKKIKLKVLPNDEQWYGVTYQEDKPLVQNAFAKLSEEGSYPSPLWQ
jgi:NDP-sugar pyrophosphorylase family protein